METLGKSIRIYLADGSPSGIKHAELVNWTGQVLMCPRGRVSELKDWEESNRPGVYFLIGDAEDGLRPLVYIGEAENVLHRLMNHLRTKDFWSRVVFITSKDQNLTKSHVKYLEARLVELATSAARVALQNETAPTLPALPRADRDAMEEFLEPSNILLGTLGLSILQPIATVSSTASPLNHTEGPAGNILYFNPKREAINARGIQTDDGFVVLEGSRGEAETRHHLSKALLEHRQQLLLSEMIEKAGECIVFKRDVLFSSPSAAAATLAGGAYNGREAWKNEEGISLKELEERTASSLVD